MISMDTGQANAFALDNLQERGDMFVAPGEEVYEGKIVGENGRDNDMAVNPTQGEEADQHAGHAARDENILLKPPRQMTLEAALEYIEDDELVEVTPNADPPAQDAAQGKRPPPRRPQVGRVSLFISIGL